LAHPRATFQSKVVFEGDGALYLAAIRATIATPAAPSSPEGRPGLLGRAWNLAKAGVQKAGSALGAAARRARQTASTSWGGLRHLKPFRGPILLALSVGAAAGVGAYFAGPIIAAGAGWLAGVLGTFAVQAAVVLRRMAARADLAW
jgi:hypothetical protein